MADFDKAIPPGGAGKVTASFDTTHYKGVVTKVVQVTTNDPKSSRLVLQVSADITPPIDVAPTATPELHSTVGEPAAKKLAVSASDGRPFDVLAVRADPAVQVKVSRADAARGPRSPHDTAVASGSSRYVVMLTPTDQAPVGRSVANVTLTTDRATAQTVSIRALLVTAGRVHVAPAQLVFDPGPDGGVMHARISKPRGGTLKILGVESSDPQFVAITSVITPGREYDLAVRDTGNAGRGLFHAQVTVRTNEPRQASIVVPLLGRR